MVAAEAELIKAQNEQAETQIGVEEKSQKIQLSARELALKEAQFEHTRNMDQVKAQKTAGRAIHRDHRVPRRRWPGPGDGGRERGSHTRRAAR